MGATPKKNFSRCPDTAFRENPHRGVCDFKDLALNLAPCSRMFFFSEKSAVSEKLFARKKSQLARNS
jgi:hypothetical protein